MGIKGSSKNYLLVLGSVALLAVSGCSGEKKAEGPKDTGANVIAPAPGGQEGQGMPEGHPPVGDKTAENIQKAAHSTIKTQKEVKLSDEVKARWKEVRLEITDNTSKKKDVLTLKVGSTTALRDAFKLKVEAFVPDYAISDNQIQSRSNEPKNPAVLVELIDGDKSVARGWIFKDFPEFNSYTDDRFTLALLAPGVEKAAAKPAAKK